jgi:hypothetical protein
VVAPEKHVLYAYSPKHDSAAVDRILAGYKGYLVADAHSVYDLSGDTVIDPQTTLLLTPRGAPATGAGTWSRDVIG